ncbi:hypothetical protein GGQ74_002419 [Desulfobaculum xiamenense]|uniref:Lipoprotein n=1 Tax=Desulfobaculum xiamenense TaxID=995050 RepID=A0A846QIQ2_9BACT|nr:hypothetical protein [Desulfobaculum xiamenense]NJB68746.1 hypothetical protein [Desulfobaculum xiamenense]
MRKSLLLTLCLVIAMALTGCGSSGDSDSSGGTISGGAGGSIFVNSTVEVFDPQKGTDAIGKGTTSVKGVFSVTGVPFGGPYIVKLTGGEEVAGVTRTDVTTPIFAIVPEVKGDEACQITPLSQFAYWVARGHAGADAIDLEDVNYAISYVQGATGVDVLKDSPVVGNDEPTDEKLTKVARTRAAIKQFEEAVGGKPTDPAYIAPSDPAFTQRVALLGFDAADGNVDGSIGGDYGKALEDAGALDATELGKAETDKAATGTAFNAKMDELGSPAFKGIVKDALDEVADESGRTLTEEEQKALVDDAAAETPEIDLNPVVGLVVENSPNAVVLPVELGLMPNPLTGRVPLDLKRADGSLEELDRDDVVTATFTGAQKAAFSFGWIEAGDESSHGVTITYPTEGFQAGEVVLTMSYKLANGRTFSTNLRIVFAAEVPALRGIELDGGLWSDLKGGIEFDRREDATDRSFFESFKMDIMAFFSPGSMPTPDEPYNLVLTVDKGELRFAGEDEDNWAALHTVEYAGRKIDDREFEYRFVGNWANDTTITLTLSDSKNPDLKTAKTFKLWEDRDALKSVTFGKVAGTFEVGDTAPKDLSVSVVAKLHDGTVLNKDEIEASCPYINLQARYGSLADARGNLGTEDGKVMLTFNYTAPSEIGWADVTDNETDVVTVTYGDSVNDCESRNIVLDLVDDVKPSKK